jgi:hypothetical protein
MSSKTSTGPTALRGSRAAKQAMVVILETLAGTCSTTEAAERLSISASRYYQLETRALQGMLTALEPRPRGPQKTKEREIRALREEKRVLERELRQARSLVRAASRSVGVRPTEKRARGSKKKARVRRGSRGTTVLKTLREETEVQDDGQERPGAAPGSDRGE